MKRGIAAGGNITVDYVKTIDSYPLQGNLSSISAVHKSVGGALPNVLLDLARMDGDLPLKAIGMVGEDEDGSRIIAALRRHGIDTGQIRKAPNAGTSFSDVMTVRDTGARTFFHYRGANQLLNREHFDFDKLDADILHIGYALLLDALDAEYRHPACQNQNMASGWPASWTERKEADFGHPWMLSVKTATGMSALFPPACPIATISLSMKWKPPGRRG
mgnify:CR=1 FL=1